MKLIENIYINFYKPIFNNVWMGLQFEKELEAYEKSIKDFKNPSKKK